MSERRYPLVERYDRKLKRTEWVETHPDSCPAGHDWTQPGSHHNAHHPCGTHRGHREWRCATTGCDQVMLDPPADDTCNRPAGPRI